MRLNNEQSLSSSRHGELRVAAARRCRCCCSAYTYTLSLSFSGKSVDRPNLELFCVKFWGFQRFLLASFSWNPRAMVDHHSESAWGILSSKASPVAMALASTDYLQEVDAASTPKMAPTTPMQAWQKPQQARESPDALPSLFLGRGSLKGAFMNLNMPHAISYKPMPGRCGIADVSTSSKLNGRIRLEAQKEGPQRHNENLLSFCLSKYENKYQTPDTATPLRNHMGPLSLHRVHAPAGHSNMLAEACASPRRHATHPDTQPLCTGLKALPEESPLHAEEPEKKLFSTTSCVTAVTYDAEVNDSAALYSPAPGEVAHDAYELYSKMFPSTCTAEAELSPSSMDADAGLYLPSPFLEHMNNMQLVQPASHDQKPLVRDRCELNDDGLESGKKIKFAKIKEEDTPGGFLDVKQEPSFYEPCRTADIKISSAALSHGDTKPFQMPLGSLSTVLCSSNSGKVVDSIDYSGGCAGQGSADVTSTKPAVGLKLCTPSVYRHTPKTLSIVTAGEPLVPLPLRPSTRVPSKTPAQGSSSTDADWGRYLALSATSAGNAETAIMLPFQQRFKELQTFLKQCDEADQNECVQALRTLSAAARSGYAVDLETRAIRLSLEEGKEMKRMRLLNVLGRISEGNLDDAGATPQGPRLPAPGSTTTPKHVP